MTPDPIRKKYEDKIRRDYEGILGAAQIEATIQWWAETLEPLYKRIEELEKEIKMIIAPIEVGGGISKTKEISCPKCYSQLLVTELRKE